MTFVVYIQGYNYYISILVDDILIPGILCSKTFLLGQPRKKVVIKSLFVSADNFLVPAANFFVPAANFFQKQLQ